MWRLVNDIKEQPNKKGASGTLFSVHPPIDERIIEQQ